MDKNRLLQIQQLKEEFYEAEQQLFRAKIESNCLNSGKHKAHLNAEISKILVSSLRDKVKNLQDKINELQSISNS